MGALDDFDLLLAFSALDTFMLLDTSASSETRVDEEGRKQLNKDEK